ncbi:MAG: hypothetical protein Kow0090_06120 [Myxococcota bacterium]
MKTKTLYKSLVAAAAALLLIIFSSSCGTEDYTLVITGTLEPDDSCIYTVPSETTVYRTSGTLDLSFLTDFNYIDYVMGMGVINMSINTELLLGQSDQALQKGLMVNTANIKITELRVTIQPAQGSEFTTVIPEYRMDHGGVVIPAREQRSADIQNSWALVSQIIPPYIVEILATDPSVSAPGDFAEILVSVVIVGETMDGKLVESRDYNFPILLCNGCLNGLPGNSVTNCPSGSWLTQDPTGKSVGSLCLFGQDGIPGKSVVYCACPEGTDLDQNEWACKETE